MAEDAHRDTQRNLAGQEDRAMFASPGPAGRASREQQIEAARAVLKQPRRWLDETEMAEAIVDALDRLSPSGEGEERVSEVGPLTAQEIQDAAFGSVSGEPDGPQEQKP